jgi:hypothetical protein
MQNKYLWLYYCKRQARKTRYSRKEALLTVYKQIIERREKAI